ncbi:MAG: hypothetical protein ACR2H1_01075, partial [Limisphaerales bacterium]
MPTNQVTPFATSQTLSVVVTSPFQTNGFPLSYQWRFNGTNIAYATTASYTFIANSNTLGNY